jgi:hypothetical protein
MQSLKADLKSLAEKVALWLPSILEVLDTVLRQWYRLERGVVAVKC